MVTSNFPLVGQPRRLIPRRLVPLLLLLTATASRASSVKVKMSSKTRGLYNKHDDRSGQDVWVTSMLLNNSRKISNEAMFKADPFARIHKAPIGSFVEMTPNAYMMNKVWMKIVPHLCDGIRAMEGITNHPDWWIVLSLDGFGSHLVGKSLEEFSKRKILVIEEEGDTSQVSQAYDQLVAKSNKKFTRALLDGYRFHTKGVINQFQLILIINSALNGTDAISWLKSFVRVNMCPSKHVPFTTWVNKQATVAAADRFFTNQTNLFDAMPVSWQKLSEDDRRNVCNLFERF